MVQRAFLEDGGVSQISRMERAKDENGVPWGVKTTWMSGQRLFLIFRFFPLWLIIAAEGCAAGIRRGLSERDTMVALCERICGIE